MDPIIGFILLILLVVFKFLYLKYGTTSVKKSNEDNYDQNNICCSNYSNHSNPHFP